MEIDGKTITLDASLWAQYDNVAVRSAGDKIVLEGRDEESYLKIFNHFGRVLTLLVFEEGQWVEAGSGTPVHHVDLSQAGFVAAATPPAGMTRSARPGAKAKAGSAKAKTRAAGTAQPKPAGGTKAKAGGARSTGTAKAGAKAAGGDKPKRPAARTGGATKRSAKP